MNDKYFDHILGNQKDETTSDDKKITKRILDAYIKEQPTKVIRENQRIGIKLQMKTYLADQSKSIIPTGEFLNQLFEIYNIKKSKFAEYIGYENANLHAILKGRRKFNSKFASIIGKVFNIEPELWLFVEAKNELKAFISTNDLKLNKFNIKEMSRNR